jgi:hypothetical protein
VGCGEQQHDDHLGEVTTVANSTWGVGLAALVALIMHSGAWFGKATAYMVDPHIFTLQVPVVGAVVLKRGVLETHVDTVSSLARFKQRLLTHLG